ncbi:hypothetical protein BH18ACT5_BH18ACT5_19500 [soil metagenome]
MWCAALRVGFEVHALPWRLNAQVWWGGPYCCHSSITITDDTYQHFTEGLDRDAADRVAHVLCR